MCKKIICLIFFFALALGLAEAQAQDSEWDRVAYWDGRYPESWSWGGQSVGVSLAAAGYTILDADELKTWMDARIADGRLSVVVFCAGLAPDTVAETMSATCTVRRYLDVGGKVVWYGDWPFYYQGRADGTKVWWLTAGAINVLGFNAATSPIWDSDYYEEVVFTATGVAWGLTETWRSGRPTSPDITENLTILATVSSGDAAAWIKHYVPGDNYRGFVRIYDRDGQPNVDDIMRVAEYTGMKASSPSPPDRAIHSDMRVNLSWSAGAFAESHDVYFGENFDDVDAGTGGTFYGNQTDTFFTVGSVGFPYPDGLVPDTTYYWRIDEINDLDPNSPWRGPVWSFWTLPDILVTDPNLVGWWKFDDGSGTIAVDSSGYGNHGRLEGDTKRVAGRIGSALDFDGTDDYVDCGNSAVFDITEELTVSAWIYMRSVPGEWQAIIAKGNSAWRISTNGSTQGMHFGFTGVGRGWLRADSTSLIPFNEWHHVCGVYDRQDGARIFIDGVQVRRRRCQHRPCIHR